MPTWYLGAYNLYNLSGVAIVRRNSAHYVQQIMFDVGFEIKDIHKKEDGVDKRSHGGKFSNCFVNDECSATLDGPNG